MPAPRSRTLIPVVVTALLLVAGCSTSGGDEDGATTTTAEIATTTTPDGGDETTTTETTTTETGDDEPADGPTREDLEGILPEASDVGDGWVETPDGGEDQGADEGDAAIEEQCPEAAGLGSDDDTPDAAKAVRTFGNADGAEVEVTLDPEAENVDADELEALVEAINGCGPIEIDGGDGSTTTFEFEAVVDEDHGDQGLRVQAALTLEAPEVGVIDLTLYVLTYRDGTVGVTITGSDGLDDVSLESIPIDSDILVAVADRIDADLTDLLGG